MLNNIRIVKIACLLLVVFTISEIYYYPITKLFSKEHLLFFTIKQTNFDNFTSSENFEHQTRTTQPVKESPKMNISHERYELVEKYEQDKLMEVDPPFKRILFWNDVRWYYNICNIW